MRMLKIEELSAAEFLPFGTFANLIDPTAEHIGTPPVEFFRDMAQEDLGHARTVSFSTCRVEPREPVVAVTEYHSLTGEGILPLDRDVLIHVGPATPPGNPTPVDRFRIFRVPRGTVVCLRPGVWHHAPFGLGGTANVLIVLPERTYANDCVVVELAEGDRIGITGA